MTSITVEKEMIAMDVDETIIQELLERDNVGMKLALIRTIEAEKRTHLAELRTGIGILTIPMSLLTILIATSNYYNPAEVFSFIFGLVIGVIALSFIGSFLVYWSLKNLRREYTLRNKVCIDTGLIADEIGPE
ncbi:MAG: hypothetical protein RTU30_11070 [Candidatus Thorarchaeota archaeon]